MDACYSMLQHKLCPDVVKKEHQEESGGVPEYSSISHSQGLVS